MFKELNPEYQVNKRVHRFLAHTATQHNIDTAKARIVFSIIDGKVTIRLYEDHKYVANLEIKSIAEFFGKDYDENNTIAVHDYLVKKSKEQKIELLHLNVVICENKSKLGAHIYDGVKYKTKISTLELLTHFYFNK